MHINKLLQPSVGADLSRTPPIYRPSVDVMMSALKRYSALSRPQPILNFNDQNRTVILSAAKDQRSEASLCPSSQTLRGVYTERSECAQGDKIFPILLVKNHYRPTANPPHTPILKLIICCLVLLAIALSACNDQSQQVDPRLKYFVIIDSRVLIEGNTAEVFGELENTSKMQFPFDVSMQADLMDINGQMVGTATGTAEDVGMGQVRQFMLVGTVDGTRYARLKVTPVSLQEKRQELGWPTPTPISP
jgi:hypothetical protein